MAEGDELWCTCTESEEEELHLLAFWKQLDQVKLKRNHLNALPEGFSCRHKGNRNLFNFLHFKSSIHKLKSNMLRDLKLVLRFSPISPLRERWAAAVPRPGLTGWFNLLIPTLKTYNKGTFCGDHFYSLWYD